MGAQYAACACDRGWRAQADERLHPLPAQRQGGTRDLKDIWYDEGPRACPRAFACRQSRHEQRKSADASFLCIWNGAGSLRFTRNLRAGTGFLNAFPVDRACSAFGGKPIPPCMPPELMIRRKDFGPRWHPPRSLLMVWRGASCAASYYIFVVSRCTGQTVAFTSILQSTKHAACWRRVYSMNPRKLIFNEFRPRNSHFWENML